MSLSQQLYDRIRDTVQWTPIQAPVDPGDLPYPTHEGLVPLGEDTLQTSPTLTLLVNSILTSENRSTFSEKHYTM